MNTTESIVRRILNAVEAPSYDIGVLSQRGMLPGQEAICQEEVIARLPLLKRRNARRSHIYLRPSGEHRFTVLDDLNESALGQLTVDGFEPCAVVETSAGNYQAWLKHASVLPKLIGTLAAQTLAKRYGADPSAADWRRFGRLPGFTNCKPKYRREDGLFPFVRLRSSRGMQFTQAEEFRDEIDRLHIAQEKERELRRQQQTFSPRKQSGGSLPSLERFRTSPKYQDRPAAADLAFCVAAFGAGMEQVHIGHALEGDYLSRDPSTSKRASYIRRTIEKAQLWVAR